MKQGRKRIEYDNNFCKFIAKHHINDNTIANACGVTRKAVRYWREYPLNMKLIHIDKISRVVGVDLYLLIDIILGDEDV